MNMSRLNIGALSRATGIPASTLRTWERRYAVPAAERTGGGQRVYDPAWIPRLQRVAEAIAAGVRPAQALGEPAPAPTAEEGWIDAARRFDGAALDRAFARELAHRGALGFVDAALPFLRALGDGWAAGELRVAHEHFASERLRDFCATQWRALAAYAEGAPVVLAAPPGERHDLPLHLAALVLAAAGIPLRFLGADTPEADLLLAAKGARAVLLGRVLPVPAVEERLREALGARLLIGGVDVDGYGGLVEALG